MSVRGVLMALSLLLVLALSLSGPVVDAQPRQGTIEGKVTNGTQGGSSIGGLDLTLFTLSSGNATGHISTRVDAGGRFEFKGVIAGAGYTYVLSATFQDAEYLSQVTAFADNETIKTVDVTVYDSTSDDASVRIVNAHTVMLIEQGSLRVQEVYVIANMSDRTYVGSGDVTATGRRETLSFPLPSEYADLQLGGDLTAEAILPKEAGFVDTLPVFPGAKEVFYTYSVDVASGSYSYARKVYYPTLSYNLLVQGEGVSVESGQLTLQSPMEVAGKQFTNLAGDDLARGISVTAELSGLAGGRGQSPLLWAGLALIVVAAGGLVALFVRRRRAAPFSSGEDGNEEERLLAEIARLDDDYEGGKISEESYRQMRDERKAELVDIMDRVNRTKAGG